MDQINSLSDMKSKELISLAEKFGIEIDSKMKKSKLIELLQQHMKENQNYSMACSNQVFDNEETIDFDSKKQRRMSVRLTSKKTAVNEAEARTSTHDEPSEQKPKKKKLIKKKTENNENEDGQEAVVSEKPKKTKTKKEETANETEETDKPKKVKVVKKVKKISKEAPQEETNQLVSEETPKIQAEEKPKKSIKKSPKKTKVKVKKVKKSNKENADENEDVNGNLEDESKKEEPIEKVERQKLPLVSNENIVNHIESNHSIRSEVEVEQHNYQENLDFVVQPHDVHVEISDDEDDVVTEKLESKNLSPEKPSHEDNDQNHMEEEPASNPINQTEEPVQEDKQHLENFNPTVEIEDYGDYNDKDENEMEDDQIKISCKELLSTSNNSNDGYGSAKISPSESPHNLSPAKLHVNSTMAIIDDGMNHKINILQEADIFSTTVIVSSANNEIIHHDKDGEVHPKEPQESITTDDSNGNITPQNMTMDKSESESYEPVKAAETHIEANQHKEEEKHEPVQVQTETTSQSQEGTEAAKQKIGGARIVRPKQLVTIPKEFLRQETEADPKETQKVVVEIIKREAGPRIVKPTFSTVSGYENDDDTKTRKKLGDASNPKAHPTAKKLTSEKKTTESEGSDNKTFKIKATKVPDFKAIHEKENKKLESIQDYALRRQERSTKLLSPCNVNPSKSPTINSTIIIGSANSTTPKFEQEKQEKHENDQKKSVVSSQNDKRRVFEKNKTPGFMNRTMSLSRKITPQKSAPVLIQANSNSSSSTNNTTKTFASTASSILTSINSNLPKFVQKQAQKVIDSFSNTEKPEQEADQPIENKEPKTPTSMSERQPHKTPLTKQTSSMACKASATLQRTISKTQCQKIGDQTIDNQNNDPNTNLARSSFIRRKSYDLNASLSKPLGYNPHVGRIKPVDFNAKSIFLASVSVPQSFCPENMNETRVIDKTTCVNKSIVQTNNIHTIKSNPSSSIDAIKKGMSALKIGNYRKSIFSNDSSSSSQNRDILMISDQRQDELRKKRNLESKQEVIKSKLMKAKLKKQLTLDERRNLDVNSGMETNDSNQNQ